MLLPRNSHRALRANPCCGSFTPSGAAPKKGNTSGMPPRTGLVPSRELAVESQSFSVPVASFHEVMVAPWRRTETDSPVGRTAETREWSSEKVTEAVGGRPGVEVRVGGRLARPTILRVVVGGDAGRCCCVLVRRGEVVCWGEEKMGMAMSDGW